MDHFLIDRLHYSAAQLGLLLDRKLLRFEFLVFTRAWQFRVGDSDKWRIFEVEDPSRNFLLDVADFEIMEVLSSTGYQVIIEAAQPAGLLAWFHITVSLGRSLDLSLDLLNQQLLAGKVEWPHLHPAVNLALHQANLAETVQNHSAAVLQRVCSFSLTDRSIAVDILEVLPWRRSYAVDFEHH